MSNLNNQSTKIKSRETFKTKFGFIWSCVGSAVGIGTIWMFPYRLGQYGGAAFLIPYLIFIVLFGLVGLSAEFALGRMAKTGKLGRWRSGFWPRNEIWSRGGICKSDKNEV